MPEFNPSSPGAFLRSAPAVAVSLLLVGQIGAFHLVHTQEYVPHPPHLQQFQTSIGNFQMVSESQLDEETQSFLKADDTLNRSYAGPNGSLSLFVAFFLSQRAGVTPHSPKVCLPGNGWAEVSSSRFATTVPGEPAPITVNRYIVSHGDERDLVLYWYQNRHHVMADEIFSKLYLIWDGLRYHRSDEALVRVIVPIAAGRQEAAEQYALEFIRSFYMPLKQRMWSD